MHAQMTHIRPLIFIRRNRVLPVAGTVSVRAGQKVTAVEKIAETTIATRHHLVDVQRTLGMKTAEDAEKLIERKPGEELQKNDIIAETGGLFSRVIRTPGPGKVISIGDGKVLLEMENRTISISAGLPGMIAEVIKDRGAAIEASVALIQGVWGNGKVGDGPLLVDQKAMDGELQGAAIGIISRGGVILAGTCTSEDIFNIAATVPVGGMILGSMPSALIPAAEAQPYPIIVLSGFGRCGLDMVSKRLLSTSSKREVILNAEKWDRMTGARPEIYISSPADGEPCREEVDYAPGQTVRVNSGANLGGIGVITKISSGTSLLPNGLRAAVAQIEFENKQKMLVPLVNLDIIDLKNVFLGKTDKEEENGTN